MIIHFADHGYKQPQEYEIGLCSKDTLETLSLQDFFENRIR